MLDVSPGGAAARLTRAPAAPCAPALRCCSVSAGDHTVGRKLYGPFLAAGIPGPDVAPTARSARAPAFLGQK